MQVTVYFRKQIDYQIPMKHGAPEDYGRFRVLHICR